MGLSVRVDEEVMAAVIEPSDNGLGVQRVMAEEGGLNRIRMHTITGNQDTVSVDYGKIFAASGRRIEFHAARLTHMPGDMMTPDNDIGPDNAGSNRPDLDLLRQFSPEYLLALEGVGEALELLYAGELSPEAAESLNTLLSNLAQLPPLMELAAANQLTPEMTERLEQLIETVLDSLDTLNASVPNLPDALSDFALDVVAEAASVAPVKPALRMAITRTEMAMGRTTPPAQRMTLSALLMGGRSGTSPLAALARPSVIKAANSNQPGMGPVSILSMGTSAKSGAASPSVSTPAQGDISRPAMAAADTAPETTASAENVANTAPKTAIETTQTQPQTETPETPAPIQGTSQDTTEIVPDAVQPDTPTTITTPASPPPKNPDMMISRPDEPSAALEIDKTTDRAPETPSDPPPVTAGPAGPDTPTATPSEVGGDTPDSPPTTPGCGDGCTCAEKFNQMARGETPDTRQEVNFITQYGQDLVDKMGVDGLKRMEAENNALTTRMENLQNAAGPTASQQDSFNAAWAGILAANNNGGGASRTQTFGHICNSGCDHANTQTVGEVAQAATAENRAKRNLALSKS